jgi:hypothetical protein
MISVDVPIQDAMEDMGMFDDRFRPLFTRWSIDAERKIGSFYSYKRDHVKATRCDANHFEIPCQVVGVMGIILGAIPEGADCGKFFRNQYQYSQSYGSAAPFNVNMVINTNGVLSTFYDPSWEIQDDQIVFMNPQSAQELTLDCIVYQTDDRGIPKVNENHRDAIAQYIKLMRSEKSIWSPGESQISPVIIDRLRDEWNRKCGNARALDGEPTATEEAEISMMYNDHLSGAKGIVWRYRDEFYWLGSRSR